MVKLFAYRKKNEVKDFDVEKYSKYSKNVIYYGPPGTGKTRRAIEDAKKLIGKETGNEKEQIKIIQFHPEYSYSDFVEKVDILNDGYADCIFKEFVKKAQANKDKNYVLIIDEINRANISEVFGELIYGLEYRNKNFTTEISGQSFSIPENLYIRGTMNTADRSLQNLDYAVRRRFSFIPIPAEPPKDSEKINGKIFVSKIFNRVKEDIEKSVARGVNASDIMPGISYFLVLADNAEEHFQYKIKYEVIPLLKEYAKNGMFTQRVKIEDNKSLKELLLCNDEYLKILLGEGEKIEWKSLSLKTK